MTLEEQILQLQNKNAQLEAENTQLREQLASQTALIAQLVECIQALEARLSQDSNNSSKPPSSDGFKRSPNYAKPVTRKRAVRLGIRVRLLNKPKPRMR